MRRIKIIALWSLGCLLLSAVGTALFLASAGDGFYRWAMQQLLEGSIDRTIQVDGTFSFDVGLEPALVVTDLWIENAPWADRKEMARAKRVEVQIELGPLFSGIVRIPRLVVEGLDLDLETSPDGQSNWEVAGARSEKHDTAAPEDLSLPLIESVSLKDIAVTYMDHQSGQDTEILLHFLHEKQLAEDARLEIRGEGSFNRQTFQITGQFGSIEEALAATVPYPLELRLLSSSLVLDLKGTARNLAAAEGFELGLSVQTPSIEQVLETWESDVTLAGRAKAAGRLTGNLESLSFEDLVIELVEHSGQELHVKGSLADLVNGKGLDLRFTGDLGPQAFGMMHELPEDLRNVLDGMTRLDLVGRVVGDLEAPVIEDLLGHLEHGSGATLSLQGHMALDFSEDAMALAGLEVSTVLSLPGPALLEQALGSQLPELGAIHATGELSWIENWITLRSLQVDAAAYEELQFSAQGRIGRLLEKQFGFELDPQLDLSASINQSRALVAYLAEPSKEAERPSNDRGEGRVPDTPVSDPSAEPTAFPAKEARKSSGKDLVLLVQQELKSAGLNPGPLDGLMGSRTRAAIEAYQTKHDLAVTGQATEDLLHRLQRKPAINRQVSALGPDEIQSRNSQFVESLPELGPVTATARLSRAEGVYRLDDLRFTLGAKDTLWIEASGALGDLRLEQEGFLENIALTVSLAMPSSKAFAQAVPPEIPELRNIKGSFDVRGSPEALSISKARIEAHGPDGLIGHATGKLGVLAFLPELATKDLAFELEVRSPSTKSVARFVGFGLPELGPVRARADLRDRADTFELTGIDVSAGRPDSPAAKLSGAIGDVLAMKRVELRGNFETEIASLLGPDAAIKEPELGKVRGRLDLSDADGSIGIDSLHVESIDTKLLSLSIEGQFGDIRQRDDLRFQTSLKVPSLSALGRELDFEAGRLGALIFTGHVSGSDEKLLAEGKGQLGETDFSGTLSGSLVGKRPALQGKLYSPVFHLADFGLLPDASAEATPAEKSRQEKEPAGKRLLGDKPIPFEALKDFDLDLDVVLDHLEGVGLDIDKAEARLTVEDGLLRVAPLRFAFVGGYLEIKLLADARPKAPRVNLSLTANDVDLGDFLAQVKVDVPLDGELDIVANLQADGLSPHALASSLDGEMDLAIARGHIRTSLLDLTTTNPVRWLFSQSVRKGYADLNCFVARFELHDGDAESKHVTIDTTNVRAEGKGDINFRDETIDLNFITHSKNRRLIGITTPFEIEGPLASPSVKVSAGGAAARTIGEVIFSPFNLLGSLLPLVNDQGKDNDNPCLRL